MINKISFSFLADCVEYFSGALCGNIIREKWVNDRLIGLDSDSAELGCYFEYYFTFIMTGKGSLPKNGQVPLRKMYKDGSKPLAPYALAEANAKRLQGYFEEMGLKIVKAGVKLTKGRFQGTIDLICECTKEVNGWAVGDNIVLDLKYSGLLDNRWDKFGWLGMLQPGSHLQKDYHGIQAKQYSYISGLPFYFLIVSSTNDYDIELLHVPVSEEITNDHINVANRLFSDFELEVVMGLQARPSISVCNSCPLKGECLDKHMFPHPKTVEL